MTLFTESYGYAQCTAQYFVESRVPRERTLSSLTDVCLGSDPSVLSNCARWGGAINQNQSINRRVHLYSSYNRWEEATEGRCHRIIPRHLRHLERR